MPYSPIETAPKLRPRPFLVHCVMTIMRCYSRAGSMHGLQAIGPPKHERWHLMTIWCFGVSIIKANHPQRQRRQRERGSSIVIVVCGMCICKRRAYATHISGHKEATTCLHNTIPPPVSHTTVQPLKSHGWTPPSRTPGGEGGMKSYPVVPITHRTCASHALLTVSPQLVLL